MERLYRPDGVYLATDHTAFESVFLAELMNAVEMVLYEFMSSELPSGGEWFDLVSEVLTGKNRCEFKDFTASIDATRMSGEMCTSLGNGFSNLMLCLFVCDQVGSCGVDALIEGDDGLTVVEGTVPTSADFAKVGLVIKLDVHKNLSEASFCGLVFDTSDRNNVTDPLVVLASTPWAPQKYCMARSTKLKTLLRCKALSIAHQYPGCPVLVSYSRYLLRVTRGHDVRHMAINWKNTYEREQLLDAISSALPDRPIGMGSRLLVESKFGLPIEKQLELEEYFDNCDVLQPVLVGNLDLFTHPSWKDYSSKYVRYSDPRDRYPALGVCVMEQYKMKKVERATYG
jgi:hypothetical protein